MSKMNQENYSRRLEKCLDVCNALLEDINSQLDEDNKLVFYDEHYICIDAPMSKEHNTWITIQMSLESIEKHGAPLVKEIINSILKMQSFPKNNNETIKGKKCLKD